MTRNSSRRGVWFALATPLVAAVLATVYVGPLAGCGGGAPLDPPTEVRRRLTQEGFQIATLTPKAGAPGEFEYTAYKNNTYCAGTASFSRNGGSTSWSNSDRCGIDEPLALARPRCESGIAASCASAAHELRTSNPPNLVDALRLAERGCATNEREACFEAGFILSRDDASAPDLTRAVDAYTKSCNGGESAACNNLGLLIRHGRGAPVDDTIACNWLERGCTTEPKDADACGALGFCFRVGRGRTLDAARAYELYTQACTLHADFACAASAQMLLLGEGVAEDAATGAAALRRLCDATPPNAEACTDVGVALHLGKPGLPQDRVAALALFERACEGGAGDGCRDAGIYHRDGLGGATRDRDEAMRRFTRGCELGDEEACTMSRPRH